MGILVFAWALSSAPAWAGAAAEELRVVIERDEERYGIRWPAGSTLIERRGFVKGCREPDGFCLSEVELAKDARLCGLEVPKSATVYVDHAFEALEHLTRSEEEVGVFLTVSDLPAQQVGAFSVEGFVKVRCDAPKGTPALRIATLAAPADVADQAWPTGTTLIWYSPAEGGGLATAWLGSPLVVRGVALDAAAYIDLYPTGELREIRARGDALVTVHGRTCRVSSARGMGFARDGAVERCPD